MTDVAILKKDGVYDVERMRTILLMNAEFNIMNNKKLGRELMVNAELHGEIALEQYGSRRHHQCILAALNKRLTVDNLRQARRAGAPCANDAKSCYDHVVHGIATLAMRRMMGNLANPIELMFSTLHKASHKIRTAFGVSHKTYGQGRDPRLQGFGQANGCGPSGWAVISTPLINLVSTAGFGFFLLTALTVSVVQFVCFAFVDDADVVHTAKDVNTSGDSVRQEMQQAIDHWESGLKATGGDLVPNKSYWYLINFVWTGEKWRYATKEDIPGDILINNVNDIGRARLQRYEASEAQKTLGVFLAMDGNNMEETPPFCNLVTGYSGNKLYRPCFCTRPLPRKGSSDNPWDPGTRIFWLNGNGCTRRRKTGCAILKAVVGGFSRRFRHEYNDSALFVFYVRNISPLLLRLMVFWLQSLGPGTVSGSRLLIPFHLGLLTNRKQPHALSASHWTYTKNLTNGMCNPQTLLTTAVPLCVQLFEVQQERSVTDPSKCNGDFCLIFVSFQGYRPQSPY
jgi:hypothetical protein